MIKNYLKTAWRNLFRNKTHSIINIAGLSSGMAVAMLIGLWIWDEVSFDSYHSNHDRIAQVKQHLVNNGALGTWSTVPFPLSEELRKNYGSDFKSVVMSTGVEGHLLSAGETMLSRNGAYFEAGAPAMFSLRMISGSLDALKDPSSIMLSESTARAFFGKEDPINRVMKIDNANTVKVAAIYEDLPSNSSFADLGFMAPWELYYTQSEWIRTAPDPWRPNAFQLYVQLIDNADFATASARIRDAKLKNVNAELAKKKPQLFLHPMNKWRLYAEFRNGINTGGRIRYVWMFGIIGAFVLLLACINFMNLSTARSEKRAREVGIRKAIGSLRSQLVYRFFSESILMAFLSFVIGLATVRLLLPFFNQVAGKQISILWDKPWFWIAGLSFATLTGVIAGSYPAFYLSSFHPVRVLKGTFKAGRFAALPRKVFVVIQFAVSVTLIVGTIVVFRQIQYTKDRPIGYDTDGLVSVSLLNGSIHNHFDAVKSELTESGLVAAMAEAGNPPTEIWASSSGFEWKGKDPNMSVDFSRNDISYDYGRTVGWKLKEGRDFSRDFATDSAALILNEAAVRFMGLEHPVGETVRWFGDPYTVVGVIDDMIMQNPYEQVRPTVYRLYQESQGFVILRINPNASAAAAIASMEQVFKKYNPQQPFQYQFADQEYARKFGNEERIGKLAGFFTLLAIFISCLGLFGMASFMAEQRVKEIGVRKILGASVVNLWGLLSKEFAIMVIVALVIAIPVAWYLVNDWLQNYQYRVNISWWIFAAAGAGALSVALLTVSYQSIRAAMANPVRSLRSE